MVSADLSGNGLSNRQVGREKTSSWETEIPLCGCLSTGVPLPRWERLRGGGDGRGEEEELALTGCPHGGAPLPSSPILPWSSSPATRGGGLAAKTSREDTLYRGET